MCIYIMLSCQARQASVVGFAPCHCFSDTASATATAPVPACAAYYCLRLLMHAPATAQACYCVRLRCPQLLPLQWCFKQAFRTSQNSYFTFSCKQFPILLFDFVKNAKANFIFLHIFVFFRFPLFGVTRLYTTMPVE